MNSTAAAASAPSPGTPASDSEQPLTDGRDTRWQKHRVQRRRELVESTLRAIRSQGHLLGMDEIAAAASTSKPVIYRHFKDRAGLYLAVTESVSDYILGKLRPALESDDEPAALLARLTDIYLELVERDANIYRFVANRPQLPDGADPINGLSERVGEEVSSSFARYLGSHGLDPTPSRTWGYGAVGFVRAIANQWLYAGDGRPRALIVAEVQQLFGHSFRTPPHPTDQSTSGTDAQGI